MPIGVAGAIRQKIRGNMTPPRGSRPTGEVLEDGRIVLKISRKRFVRQVVRDPDGAIQYHLRADGSKRAPMYENVETTPDTYEFVIEDLGNGLTKENRDFRPGADEVARAALRERREKNLDALAEALEQADRAGLSPADLIASIQSLAGVERPAQDGEPVEEEVTVRTPLVPESLDEPSLTESPPVPLTPAQERAAKAREAAAVARAARAEKEAKGIDPDVNVQDIKP